jgi:AcrR family transcriptional regulator
VFPERSDRLRHREQIRDAACRVFARSGVDASPQLAAAKAGVGVGTLYRHFDTRAALILAVLDRELERLGRRAPRLLRSATPPGEAVSIWLAHLAEICLLFRGVAGHLLTALHRDDSALSSTAATIRARTESLLTPAREAFGVRADVTADDLLMLVLGAVGAAEHSPRDPTPTATRLTSLATGCLHHPTSATAPETTGPAPFR